MRGKVAQFTIDWLSYTVDCPHELVKSVTKSGVVEQMEIYEGRSLGTKIEQDVNYLPIALQAALPVCLLSPTSETGGVTIFEGKYAKIHISNYDTKFQLQTIDGEIIGTIAWHSRQISQGIHVQMTGADLETLKHLGYDLNVLLKQAILMQNAKVTRLDLVIDVETKQKPYKLYSKVRNGTIRSEYLNPLTQLPMYRKVTYIENDMGKTGSGIYFGSPASDRRARIYDKGVQRGEGENLLRVEMVARDEQAREWARIAIQTDIQTAAVSFYRDFIMGWDEMDTWISHAPGRLRVSIPRKPRPGSLRWLQSAAGPAMLKALARNDEFGAQWRALVLQTIFGGDVVDVPQPKLGNSYKVHKRGVAYPYRVNASPVDNFKFDVETVLKFFVQTPFGLRPKQLPL